jgi:hypothetical protein
MPCAKSLRSGGKTPDFAGDCAPEGFSEGLEEVLRFAQ